MNNIIHVHIYDPSRPSFFGKPKANDRSQLHIYTCTEKEQCDAYKKGQCINVGNAFGARCPLGKKLVSSGFTRKAKAHYSQISDWKEKYSEHYNALTSAPKKITKVPTGWMLPYNFINMDKKIPFASSGGLFSGGCPFLLDKDMNNKSFNLILSARPQAMMGGTITAYTKEVMPKFVKDFSDNYPDEFKIVSEGCDAAKEILSSYSYIGRKAYLKTVKHNTRVKISKSEYWYWDGEKILKENEKIMIFEPIKWVECYASFTPTDEATIEITDSNQVTEHTKFAD